MISWGDVAADVRAWLQGFKRCPPFWFHHWHRDGLEAHKSEGPAHCARPSTRTWYLFYKRCCRCQKRVDTGSF